MPAEKPCWSVECGVGRGGLGGHLFGWAAIGQVALGPPDPYPSKSSLLLSAPVGPVKQPLPPPLPSSPHLDQLDVRAEPLQAGLQGAQ